MQFSIDKIVEILQGKCEVLGNTSLTFDNAKPIHEANENSLAWIANEKADKGVITRNTAARILICNETAKEFFASFPEKCFVIVDDPRLSFIRVVGACFSEQPNWGIHPTAVIHAEATIHPESKIGPYCVIGKATIGKGSMIDGHVFIYDNVTIGKSVLIHAGTVIGNDGFGYQRNERGEFEKFPHIGGVLIEDNVEIGSNTCIDKGALGNTTIKEGAKIDNLVHIAHNVVVGKHAAVIALAMVGGSTKIGDYGWVAPSASLRDRISIGENATIGLGAVVTKSIPDNEIWIGNPAQQLKKK